MIGHDDIEGCRYILGELKSEDPWHYCGAPRRQGSSYCEDHHTICYSRLRRRMGVETSEVTAPFSADMIDHAA